MKMLLKEVSPLKSSILVGIFLGILFVVERAIPEKQITTYGFIVAFITIVICGYIYNKAPLKPTIKMDNKKLRIKRLNPWTIAIVVGLFEAAILTIMEVMNHFRHPLFYNILPFQNKFLESGLFGLIAGFIGALIAVLIYNFIIKRTRGIQIEIGK